MSDDLISRQAAVDALWKALCDYEEETEKQFIESDELDVGEWIGHRIFVQNMNDIDRQTILNLPSAEPEIIRCKDCKHNPKDTWFECPLAHLPAHDDNWCWKGERKDG